MDTIPEPGYPNLFPPSHQPKARINVMEAVEDVIYGSAAGVVGKYIEYPFDTVKVRLQSQPDGQPLRYKGPIDCFRQSIRADGVLGLYRGITAPLVGAAAETSCIFFFERLGRDVIVRATGMSRDRPLPLPALWFTGAFSGVFTSFILTPIELVKCKIQVPASPAASVASVASAASAVPPPMRPLQVIRDIYRQEGLLAFWHGQMGTLIREAGGCAAWFGAKETVSDWFRKLNTSGGTTAATMDGIDNNDTIAGRALLPAQPLPLWQQALAGAAAGVSYNFLFFPADTVKSRMQTTPIGGSARAHTFWSEARAIWDRYGVRGLYRGCGITCLRSAPSSAFIFMVYDGLKTSLPLR